jgi:hypothetical protein
MESGQCSGALVATGWVLTAAHCTIDSSNAAVPAADFRVAIGDKLLDTRSDWKHVTQVVTNPHWTAGSADYDAALLALKTGSSASPIDLPSSSEVGVGDPGTSPFLYGWGVITASTHAATNRMQETSSTLVDNSYCTATYPSTFTARDLCGRPDPGAPCIGDDGGPLVEDDLPDDVYLDGIFIFGDPACGTGPAAYSAFLSSRSIRSWVQSTAGLKAPKITSFAAAPYGHAEKFTVHLTNYGSDGWVQVLYESPTKSHAFTAPSIVGGTGAKSVTLLTAPVGVGWRYTATVNAWTAYGTTHKNLTFITPDLARPVVGLSKTTAKLGKTLAIKYFVADNSLFISATITLYDGTTVLGKVKSPFKETHNRKAKFKSPKKKGTYRVCVKASDFAGNHTRVCKPVIEK